jgi:Protein of unknown function (DUF938)
VHNSPGNAEFDASLRARNPQWGVRDLADIAALAQASGFSAPKTIEMPASNASLLFHRL